MTQHLADISAQYSECPISYSVRLPNISAFSNTNAIAEEDIGQVIGRIRELGGDRIAFIALYGSVTKNRDTPLSDIDLAVFL